MVNISTNIIKTSNDLSPQSLHIKKTTTCNVGNPGPCLGQTQQYGGANPANGIPNPLLITAVNIYVIIR